jgi:hypothetical protein
VEEEEEGTSAILMVEPGAEEDTVRQAVVEDLEAHQEEVVTMIAIRSGRAISLLADKSGSEFSRPVEYSARESWDRNCLNSGSQEAGQVCIPGALANPRHANCHIMLDCTASGYGRSLES